MAGSNLLLIETGERVAVNEDTMPVTIITVVMMAAVKAGDGGTDNELIVIGRISTQQLFGKKPHHNAGAENYAQILTRNVKSLGV